MSTRKLELTFVGDASQLSKTFAKVQGLSGGFAQNMTRAGKTLTRNLTLPIVGAGVAAGKLAFDFQDSMNKVQALVGVSAKQVDAWGKQILDLAPKVGKSPKELADALYFITSSGIETSKTIDALTVSAKLSTAGLGETQGIADGLTSAINAYAKSNLTAADAGDVFAATVREGKAEASSIAPVLGNVLPIASQMGVSFDQVGAAIAAMTLQGTDASTAVTNLSAIFSTFLKPSVQGAAALKDVGLSAADVRKEMKDKGLLATLEDLRGRFKGNDEQLAKVIPNIRALRGILQLTGGDVGKTEKLFARLAKASGDTNEAFDATAQTANFKMRASLAKVQAEGVKIGATLLPIAADVASGIGVVLDKFDALSSGQKKWTAWGLVAAAALGPVARLTGGIASGVGLISKGLGALKGAAGVGAVGRAAGAGGLGVQKVWVVNPGFGGAGGVGGAARGAAGAAGVAVPGLGAGIGAGGVAIGAGSAAALGALAIGAVVGAGIGLNALDKKYHFFTADPADIKKEARKAQQILADEIKKGAQPTGDQIRKALGGVFVSDATARDWSAAAKKGVSAFREGISKEKTGVKRSAAEIRTAALNALDGLPPAAQKIAALTMIQMARSLEKNGQAPKGSTRSLVQLLNREIGKLPPAFAAAASSAAASLGELNRTLAAIAGEIRNVVAAASSARSAGGRALTAGEQRQIRQGVQTSQERGGRRGLPSNPSFALARVPIGSSTDLSRTGSRGDRAANTARVKSERSARGPGVSEEDIRQAGERAYIAARKRTIKTLRTKINARRKALIAKLKKYDINARRKVKVPGAKWKDGKPRQTALDRRAAMKQAEQEIRGELETLAVDYADLAAESRDLDLDIAALDRTDEAESAQAADDAAAAAADAAAAAPTAGDFLDAAAAEAALTPGLQDDLAAARAIEDQANASLAAARASGDPRRIADAARNALSARQSREQIEATLANTDALAANTEALQGFGGSTVFSYRGQDFALRSLAPPSSDRLIADAI